MDARCPSSEDKSIFASGIECEQLRKSRTGVNQLQEDKGKILGYHFEAGGSPWHTCFMGLGR